MTSRSSTTRKTTELLTTTTELLTTIKTIENKSSFPISGIIGIVIGSLLTITILSLLIFRYIEYFRQKISFKSRAIGVRERLSSVVQQYFLATRANINAIRKSKQYISETTDTISTISTRRTLVDVEC